ncbi:MAG: RNA polymerase sigma factor [Sphingomonas sp.]|uniref:RNA polymerase sigma factor n=1 Tax=unclassified Sphingomonas TaxID=196159 RepID=UPI002458CEB9|nr:MULTISPECIES: RNA polymerase sigma factor [unclassified Sphingomonas]MBQ1497401.1 RNA polymerase sigma factor [Sphingomonas sp.]MDH4746439.1 RNA polymerase sigma factor [Sphingomonas sp. CBMAI 2297]
MPDAARHPGLDEVVAQYRMPLLRFFQRRVEHFEDADDLVQDVFSRLAAQDLAAIANVQGYVFQVAANVLRDKARRASVRSIMSPAPEGFDVEDEAGFSPERILQSREALQIMIAALYELPEIVRMVFSQYHFDGVAQVEIARRTGLSLSTVEKHMARANGHLLHRLRKAR